MEFQTNLKGEKAKPWADACCEACYNAEGERCVCRCGGQYHGLGRKKNSETNNAKEKEK